MAIVTKKINGYGPYKYKVEYVDGEHVWTYLGPVDGGGSDGGKDVTNDDEQSGEVDLDAIDEAQLESAEVLAEIGGNNKDMTVREVGGEEVVVISNPKELDGHPESRSTPKENMISVPPELREMGVNAPKTEEVGDYIVMEYVENAESAEFTSRNIDLDEYERVTAAMLATGNPDATAPNILVDDEGELWAVDHDWADMSWKNTKKRWKEYSAVPEESEGRIIDMVEEFRNNR